jgi:rhamnosyltransferase
VSAPWARGERYCAGVVLFHPDGSAYLESIEAILRAGLTPIIFDNSEDPASQERIRTEVTARFQGSAVFLSEGGNIGLSAAYNRIITAAEALGAIEAVILLDQDSTVPVQSIHNLIESYRRALARRPVGVLSGMAMRPDLVPYRFYPMEDPEALPGLLHVRMAPSSFSLIPLSTVRTVGRFYDDFFIDHIDVDFCLRCHRHGLLVAIDPSAPFPHQIGHGLVTLFGHPVSPISSPFRHYYQVRNIILSARRRGASWIEAFRELAKRFAVIGIVGFSAGGVFARYGYAFRGLRDALGGRGGRMPR